MNINDFAIRFFAVNVLFTQPTLRPIARIALP
jgi:hypothetical protein